MLTIIVGGTQEHLDVLRIADIKKEGDVFLTLDGRSGIDDEDLRKATECRDKCDRINTERRLARQQGLESALAR
jgi:hypothetical protein